MYYCRYTPGLQCISVLVSVQPLQVSTAKQSIRNPHDHQIVFTESTCTASTVDPPAYSEGSTLSQKCLLLQVVSVLQRAQEVLQEAGDGRFSTLIL